MWPLTGHKLKEGYKDGSATLTRKKRPNQLKRLAARLKNEGSGLDGAAAAPVPYDVPSSSGGKENNALSTASAAYKSPLHARGINYYRVPPRFTTAERHERQLLTRRYSTMEMKAALGLLALNDWKEQDYTLLRVVIIPGSMMLTA